MDSRAELRRTAVVYLFLLVLVGAVVSFLVSRTEVSVASASPVRADHGIARVLVALATIAGLARAFGFGFARYLGQPPVVGETFAGLVLGPSVLGAVAPAVQTWLFPPTVMPHVSVLAKLGVVLFMFLVGLELDAASLRANARRTVTIAHASIAVPFALGVGLASMLQSRYGTVGTPFSIFAAFVGVSLSVTAFPVLARILEDRGLRATPIGRIAIACAAIDDVTAWCLLAAVSGAATASIDESGRVVLLSVGFVVAMLAVVRPVVSTFARRFDSADRSLAPGELAAVLASAFACAAATEVIGIHALFGSFLLGSVFPHDGRLARELEDRVRDLVVVLFLPLFFAYSGLRTQIGLLDSGIDVLVCVAVIVVATLGKFGGTYVASRLLGHTRGDATTLGILMNTRGLMELIVLNVGLELGVLSPKLFTILVVMALVTTFATTPLLGLVRPRAA